ncbi:DsrE family protein [Geothrix alkalitolerans]|uniref:DsrE family protein n=1 Tax=Geothrix alkalitolerans TaxID=2922724 RepID=UPI001FAE960B|nr:DsrE family protein [Geothrix alkalitolerans]
MSKTAIVVFADPKPGTDEAFGRLSNALILTSDLKQRGEEVALVFQGAGTRWAAEVTKADHPMHGLFRSVEDKFAGVCNACAAAYDTLNEAEASGLPVTGDFMVPGIGRLISLGEYITKGYQIVLF